MMNRYLLILFSLCFLFTACEVTGYVEGETNDDEAQQRIDDARRLALESAQDTPPVVEVRYFIEPKLSDDNPGGSFVKKLTLPKNYNGKLYLSGINLTTLSGKNVKVRFKLGKDKANIIDIPATVTTTTGIGITPNSILTVLVMDFGSALSYRPFDHINLIYDLYDYNDYAFEGSSAANALDDPVQYNRDSGLFCRGLSLEDDPSFNGDLSVGCQGSDDICKYAYAKVVDQGLTYNNGSSDVFIVPDLPAIAAGTNGYYEDSDELKLRRCLPDNPFKQQVGLGSLYSYYLNGIDPLLDIQFGLFSSHLIDSQTYIYNGPYRLTATTDWQILYGSSATTQRYGLYQEVGGLLYESKLFPRYAKKTLSAGVQYLGADTPNDAKVTRAISSSGESLWMDGCSERASSRDSNGAHVGSCEVTGEIEVFYVDDNSIEQSVSISKDIKLQLVKDANLTEEVTNILNSSFNSCSSSSQCSSGECCVNGRCWGEDIVSACVEDGAGIGNQTTGSTCTKDVDCASLCCSGGTCQPHDPENNTFCNKPIGGTCVEGELCTKQTVTECYVINSNVINNVQQCELRCYNVERSGQCTNGTCRAPIVPAIPTFDPNDVNRCNNACDPPDLTLPEFVDPCVN